MLFVQLVIHGSIRIGFADRRHAQDSEERSGGAFEPLYLLALFGGGLRRKREQPPRPFVGLRPVAGVLSMSQCQLKV